MLANSRAFVRNRSFVMPPPFCWLKVNRRRSVVLPDKLGPLGSMISGLYKSIVRSTSDLIEEIKTTTGNQEIEYHAWESRADEDKLPTKTLIGIDGFSFEENPRHSGQGSERRNYSAGIHVADHAQ